MPFFKKRVPTPAFDSLKNATSSIGAAVGQVAIGSMPPDYVDAVINVPVLQDLFEKASEEVGAQEARKEAVYRASMTAGIWAERLGLDRAAKKEAARIVGGVIDGTYSV